METKNEQSLGSCNTNLFESSNLNKGSDAGKDNEVGKEGEKSSRKEREMKPMSNEDSGVSGGNKEV